jgi:hypothetical protein
MAAFNRMEKEKQLNWARAIAAGDWHAAMALADTPLFSIAERVARRLPGESAGEAGEWCDQAWFGRCKDAAALGELLDRLDEAESEAAARAQKDASGDASASGKKLKSKSAITTRAVSRALATGNETALAALKARRPRLFTKKALSEGLAELLSRKEWIPAQNAAALRARLEAMERWADNFSAKKTIASWSDPRELFTAAIGLRDEDGNESGRAAVARLAIEEAGLDPWAKASLASTSHDPVCVALMALNCGTPDLFLEFVRAGVDPDELKIEADSGSKRVIWPQGIMGGHWSDIEWPESLDTSRAEARERKLEQERRAAASGPTPGRFPILIMTRNEPHMRAGTSARELIEAAIVAKKSSHGFAVFRMGAVEVSLEERQARWRSGWEAHVLRETTLKAGSAAARPMAGTGPSAEAEIRAKNTEGDASQTRRGPRL